MKNFTLSAFADEIDDDLNIQMDVLDQHDIKHIEMRSVCGKNITLYTKDEIKEIKKLLDQRGFKISAIGSPIGKIMITDDFKPHLELFKHTIEIAKILETDNIRMFSFYIPKNEDPAIYRNEVMKRWQVFVDITKGTGMNLLHENEKDIYGDTAKRCLDLIETMDCDHVKAIFDPANFVQCNVTSYPDAYEIMKEHVVYMHIKDAILDSYKVVPSGMGDGGIKEILSDLKKKDFCGYLSLEPHLGSFSALADLELNIDVSDMSEGGPKQFSIACNALKKILNDLEEE